MVFNPAGFNPGAAGVPILRKIYAVKPAAERYHHPRRYPGAVSRSRKLRAHFMMVQRAIYYFILANFGQRRYAVRRVYY
jgi:hypothetical protein